MHDAPNLTENKAGDGAASQRTVILERRLGAPPDEVFKSWTNPDLLARWLGPEGFTTSEVIVEPRVGGRWAITMTSPEGTRYASSGELREYAPPERLVVLDEGKGEPMLGRPTRIHVTFSPSGAGTAMRLVHGVFKSSAMRDECARGWSSTFDRLERLMRGEAS